MCDRRIFLFLATVAMVTGYPMFQKMIPNGAFIPNPCDRTNKTIWSGVGHENKAGGGPRNPFGLAFYAQGTTWTKALCQADSDGDGMTNGAELGDPNCIWVEGDTPTLQTGLTHPGICEPLDSEICRGKNDFLNCEEKPFECEGMNDAGIVEKDIRLTETAVPAKETTYMCQAFSMDLTVDHHIIAATPIIETIDVVHHAVIYGCQDDANTTKFETPQQCFMEGAAEACEELIVIWAYGVDGICFHQDAGFRVGPNGFKTVILEMHWNNPFTVATYRDSSGMKLYMTPNLRPYDAGTQMIGQSLLLIPPGENHVSVNSTCSSGCTKELMTGPINIFGVMNHMHYLGTSAYSHIVSKTTGERTPLAIDDVYDYDSPAYVSFDDPHVAMPGDELTLVCNFKSTSREKTTFFGFGSSDEMCFAFLMYYPKENWVDGCTSTGPIDTCEWDDPVVAGCDRDYWDPTNEKAIGVYMDVDNNCLTSVCRKECKNVVREIFKNPCYQFPLKYIIQENGVRYADTAEQKLAVQTFYYKMDSCAAELAVEKAMEGGHGIWPPTSGASDVTLRHVIAIATVLLAIL